jgi:hypothetical protein
MKRALTLLAAASLTTLLTAGSCGQDPCAGLAPPSAGELAAVQAGAEVERELSSGVDCELVGNGWQRETD